MPFKWLVISLATLLAIAVGLQMAFPKNWTGSTATSSEPERITEIGHYRCLETCRTEVEKGGGGWCGKDCTKYSDGSVADCAPLIQIAHTR